MPRERIAFELMNEPWLRRGAESERWPAMLAELHDRAREAAPGLPLILTDAVWSDRLPLMKRARDARPARVDQNRPQRRGGTKVLLGVLGI